MYEYKYDYLSRNKYDSKKISLKLFILILLVLL